MLKQMATILQSHFLEYNVYFFNFAKSIPNGSINNTPAVIQIR